MFFLKPFHFMNSAHFAQVFFCSADFFCLRSASSFSFGSSLLLYFSIGKKLNRKKQQALGTRYTPTIKKLNREREKRKETEQKPRDLDEVAWNSGQLQFESIAKRLAHKMYLNMTTWPMIWFRRREKKFHENAAITSTWELTINNSVGTNFWDFIINFDAMLNFKRQIEKPKNDFKQLLKRIWRALHLEKTVFPSISVSFSVTCSLCLSQINISSVAPLEWRNLTSFNWILVVG